MRQKLLVFNSVVRSKMIYGLESLQLTDAVKHKLDIFQLKALRKILKLKTTYSERHNTNERVYQLAEEATSIEGRPPKRLQRLSEIYETNKIHLYAKLLTLEENDPRAAVAFASENIHAPHDHGTKTCRQTKDKLGHRYKQCLLEQTSSTKIRYDWSI